jgi:NAD(P)-dependent dehydrogenase (short-subunit alcohol dehydrogenase family)
MAISTTLFDLTGRVAVVTGGAGSIGSSVARRMAQHGAKVLLADVKDFGEKKAMEMNKEAKAAADEPLFAGVQVDVTNQASVDRAIRKAMDLFGRLDIVVSTAGQMCKKPTFDLTTEEFNDLYNTHVAGSLRCAQAAGRVFREQHSGCVINIASISSFVDLIEVTAYACAKSAMMGLTRSLANEWAKYGIRVNAIAPGFFPTAINRKMIENTDRGRRILEHTPMGRFGDPDELAGAAIFLASDAAKFVTGHTLVVDGGYLACGIGDSVAPWAGKAEV